MRGVFIFKDVTCQDLQQKEPVNIVTDMRQRQELLERFNFKWKDWTFRDIIEVEKKYSENQREYFATAPKDRWALLEKFKQSNNCEPDSK